MEYFASVVSFVARNTTLIVTLFLAVCLIEFIVFLFKKKGGKFNTDGLFICIATNLVVTIGLYILACLGVGIVNCIADQNWHFWSSYVEFMSSGFGTTILGIVLVGSFLYFMFSLGWIAAIFASMAATGVAFLVGFLVYIVVAIVIIILKVLWFVVSGFFISIFAFVVMYWQMSLIVLIAPGVIYGACCALANYIGSFKQEVVHK